MTFSGLSFDDGAAVCTTRHRSVSVSSMATSSSSCVPRPPWMKTPAPGTRHAAWFHLPGGGAWPPAMGYPKKSEAGTAIVSPPPWSGGAGSSPGAAACGWWCALPMLVTLLAVREAVPAAAPAPRPCGPWFVKSPPPPPPVAPVPPPMRCVADTVRASCSVMPLLRPRQGASCPRAGSGSSAAAQKVWRAVASWRGDGEGSLCKIRAGTTTATRGVAPHSFPRPALHGAWNRVTGRCPASFSDSACQGGRISGPRTCQDAQHRSPHASLHASLSSGRHVSMQPPPPFRTHPFTEQQHHVRAYQAARCTDTSAAVSRRASVRSWLTCGTARP